MEKHVDLFFEFAKDNGVGVAIPVSAFVVMKVWQEDYKERKATGERNHADIQKLEINVATLQAKLEALEKAVY